MTATSNCASNELHARTPQLTRARAVGRNEPSPGVPSDGCRRPIQPAETPYLSALGNRLRELRRDRGLTQAQLAVAADLSRRHVERLEAGTRRTRRSTLSRIAEALGGPSLENELVTLAGPALAQESDFAERVARRRARRVRKQAQARAKRERQAETLQALEALKRFARFGRPISSASFSAGVAKRSVLRGRPLSFSATSSRRSWRIPATSVPFGKYWRSRPLVFSFEPRCQGLWGSQK